LRAFVALAAMGPDAHPAVPRLIQLMTSEPQWDFDIRPDEAMQVLGAIGPPAKAAVPGLMKKLKSNDALAVETLGLIGKEAKPAVPRLLEILKNGDKGAIEAALALWRIDRRKDGIAFLVTALSEETKPSYFPQGAIRALREMGPEAKPAVPAL